MVTVRRATAEDCPRIMELIRELAEYERAPQEVSVNYDHFVNSGFGEKPVWWALVADEEGVVQGFALYYIRYSTWKGQAMYLEDLLVTQQMRGRGIGQMLLDALKQDAKEKKLPRIVWQVLEWNEPAIAFYKKNHASFDGEWVNCAIEV